MYLAVYVNDVLYMFRFSLLQDGCVLDQRWPTMDEAYRLPLKVKVSAGQWFVCSHVVSEASHKREPFEGRETLQPPWLKRNDTLTIHVLSLPRCTAVTSSVSLCLSLGGRLRRLQCPCLSLGGRL